MLLLMGKDDDGNNDRGGAGITKAVIVDAHALKSAK
jgi:hypothetical protein